VPVIPIGAFLAGALLSLLLPVFLLIALVVWYLLAIKHLPSGRQEPAAESPAHEAPTGGDGLP
jgi:hypothetical protein